ncbi:ZYRO0G18964p [Zygosaccharomyces rouxii]|uniref:ZYRO0G18964p n=1 Tax=Zygosaccharomyces rouxii (strain ATCC 2623 / CBS 732 / NBRC 1130 / NCYC 568 / NRRL Y-229) TaxID=559307 RepID=C5E188_ZYGRC|nr:uncharacterized protein ZYRO0G18964g [Zygosaccharomyces rouxii]KAH9202865.1 armadillo-type protein [Zygosaccharomyces rouxii]CAR29872.1 ZYRO0G18964p [Zygosaccharomyces rouxii]
MSYHHQPQLSVNSIQSLVEPVTPPPLGQMSNKKNHTKTQSLDLSEFNQFMQNQSPMMMAKTFSPPEYQSQTQAQQRPHQGTSPGTLPLINEFDVGFDPSTSANGSGASMHAPGAPPAHVPTAPSASIPSVNTNSSTSSSLRTSSGTEAMEITSAPLEELDYVKLATDQFGCRFLQKKLESPAESNLVRDLMYEQIKGCFLDLILDSFGNYLVQKLCEYLTLDQKTFLIQVIYPHVFQISINQYGTRSLQKIIDTVDNESQIDLITKGFSQEHTSIEQVVTLINDLNGNHVIQKCIFKFPPSKFDFIIDAIVEHNNIITISTHKHGCCVLQKLLSVCTLQQIFKISVKIVQFLPGLINDQFGNYIIQFLLDIKELDFYLLAEIFNRLSNELCQLSCLKFSSNVVEKFIKKLFGIVMESVPKAQENLVPEPNDDVVTAAMGILLTIIDIFTVNLNVLIRDNFGNYALQTLLDVKNYGPILEYPGNSFVLKSVKLLNFSHDFTTKIGNLVILTKEFLPSIKTTSYAKKIKLKVKAYAELTGIAFADLSPKKNTGGGNFNNNGNHFNNHRNNGNSNNNKFNHYKNGGNVNANSAGGGYSKHARHFSLPANAFHRRNSSSVSSLGVLPQAQTLQLPQTPMGGSNGIYGHNQFLAPQTTTATNSAAAAAAAAAAASGGSFPPAPPPQFVPTTAAQIPSSQKPFVSAPLPKPNSNPNLQGLQGHTPMPFSSDMGNSTNSSGSSLFHNTMNDPFVGKNFAFTSGSQSSLCEPNFAQQRVVSNPFPLQQIPQQPSMQQAQFMNNYMPIRAVEGGMYMGANGSNTNDFINSGNEFNLGFR